ncbi:MAG TPA: prepilin-type N-terminal cleavage/methylation domain-containing protein [Candidatus Hydrogenedentes bacterium]|nr:prepilin-type N-terminal cleavage/methylation domain-containing protein [Candidatus Hydrogenedentota bacterium]
MRRPCHGWGGFTLLELVVVLSLIAILTGLVVPVYGGSMASMRMRGAQSDFLSLIRYVQERAITDAREYRLYIDGKENEFWVMYMTGMKDGEKVFEEETRDYGRRRAFPDRLVVERVRGRKDRDRNAHYITCYPNGACDVARVDMLDAQNRRRRTTIETTGVVGKNEIKTPWTRR